MSIFGEKEKLTPYEFGEKLRRDSGKIPGSNIILTEKERLELAKEIVSENKNGHPIDEKDLRDALDKIEKGRGKALTQAESWHRKRDKDYWGRLLEPEEPQE